MTRQLEPNIGTMPPTGAVLGSPNSAAEDELEPLLLVSIMLKRWKHLLGIPIVSVSIAIALSFVLPSKYTSIASFVPETQSSQVNLPAPLSGLASQFGLGVAGGSESPRFYADLLFSRILQERALESRFQHPSFASPSDSTSLLDILSNPRHPLSKRTQIAREKLTRAMSVSVDNETSIVTVTYENRDAVLSADVLNMFLGLLNDFNLEFRQANAHERRRFTEQRVRESETELRNAEEALKTFLEQNRQFESAELTFQYERLQRQVRITEEIFTALRRRYEEARLAEMNDIPLMTIIDEAVPPQQRSSPKRLLIAVLGFILGIGLALFWVLTKEYFENAAERGDKNFQELVLQWTKVKAQFTSPRTKKPS